MDTLTAGQQLNFTDQLESANASVKLVMQADSNLVLYRNDTGGVLWATNTRPSTGMTHVIMQSDGNLVLYSASNNKVGWASNTYDHPGASVKLHDDGNLVISDASGATLWSTGTVVFPSAADIAKVQTNLKNMQAFNDYVYNQGTSRVLNAYLLLSAPDTNDPGLTVALNVLEGAFSTLGSELGPLGNFAGSFLSGMVSGWASSAPPSLNATFASMLLRLQATSLAVDAQLASYHSNVEANWSTAFAYNGTSTKLSDLATGHFPAETDPAFEKAAAAALFGLDKQIWTTVMVAKYVLSFWNTQAGEYLSGDTDMTKWHEHFIAERPAYRCTWTWHDSTGWGDQTGWAVVEHNIGTGVTWDSDGSMNSEACRYLFIDSADGVVINPNGLFTRSTVFTGLGIREA